MSARFLVSDLFVVGGARARFAREHHLERDEEKQQSAKDPERVDGDAHRRQESGADHREEQKYSACN